MSEHSAALFNSFAGQSFGGSVAAVVADAADLDPAQMQQIAREFGAPATCFIMGMDDATVEARFFSTTTEYSMCGHGTIALMTWLVERGEICPAADIPVSLSLRTPVNSAAVEVRLREDGRPEVMLALDGASFDRGPVDAAEAAALFGIEPDLLHSALPIESTESDFTHLVVPVRDLAAMASLVPDFGGISALRERLGIDTVVVFTLETENPEGTVRCRDFCPGVGTDEAAATGTTNRALACYLLRHGLIDAGQDGVFPVVSEQGYEMGRPSEVRTELTLMAGELTSVKVGGIATRTLEGSLRVS